MSIDSSYLAGMNQLSQMAMQQQQYVPIQYGVAQGMSYSEHYPNRYPNEPLPKKEQKSEDKKTGVTMISEVKKDLKQFVKDHKSTIYLVAVLMLFDHFFFEDAFKIKLKDLMQKMIGKVEAKLNDSVKV